MGNRPCPARKGSNTRGKTVWEGHWSMRSLHSLCCHSSWGPFPWAKGCCKVQNPVWKNTRFLYYFIIFTDIIELTCTRTSPWTVDVSHFDGPAITDDITNEFRILSKLIEGNCSCNPSLIEFGMFTQSEEGLCSWGVYLCSFDREGLWLQSRGFWWALHREAKSDKNSFC